MILPFAFDELNFRDITKILKSKSSIKTKVKEMDNNNGQVSIHKHVYHKQLNFSKNQDDLRPDIITLRLILERIDNKSFLE